MIKIMILQFGNGFWSFACAIQEFFFLSEISG